VPDNSVRFLPKGVRVAMHIYRCFFLDDQQLIKGAEIIEAEALREAVSRALESFEARPQYSSVEIWFGANRIYQAEREKP
jgi:hypothetical protein